MKSKEHDADGKVKTWLKTPTPNLIRYGKKGKYYLRGRFGGGPVRECLDTDDYRIARTKLIARMEQLRAVGNRVGKAPDTLFDSLAVCVAQTKADPSIMASTRENYLWSLAALGNGKGAALPGKLLAQLTEEDMREWWAAVAANYAAQQANHLLMWAKRVVEIARKAGGLRHDPMPGLKRLTIARKRRSLLSVQQFRALITELRKEDARAQRLADWFEFAAYSGARPGEQIAVEWRHVDERKGRIEITEGKTVNQTGKTRYIPIIGPMRELLKRLPREGEKLFARAQSPRCDALKNACAKLKLPRQRVYDFRHLFATRAIESGVDVPTLSRWLGHSDGGALVMKTYVHPGEEHSMAAAKRVKF